MPRGGVPQRTASRCDQGRRSVNQDAVVIESVGGAQLVAVADGMGGHRAGEVASRRALEVLVTELGNGSPLESSVHNANAAVYADSESNQEWRGMGTTLVALLRTGDQYMLANVGDSRAYRIAPGDIRQITLDHSFMAEALRGDRLSEEEATRSPWADSLTRALGTEPRVEVDLFGPFSTREPHLVLLCTDGLYKSLPDGEIERITSGSTDVEELVGRLAEQAYSKGSTDNITVAVVEFGEESVVGGESVGRDAAAAAPEAAPGRDGKRRRRRARRRPQPGKEWSLPEKLVVGFALAGVLLYVIVLALLA